MKFATRPRCVLAAVVDAAGLLGAASGAGFASIGRPTHGAGLSLPALLSCPAPRPPSGVTQPSPGTVHVVDYCRDADRKKTRWEPNYPVRPPTKKARIEGLPDTRPKRRGSDRTRLKALMARHEHNYECCHVSNLPKPAYFCGCGWA
jgi:hypothetical protein